MEPGLTPTQVEPYLGQALMPTQVAPMHVLPSPGQDAPFPWTPVSQISPPYERTAAQTVDALRNRG
eukprot:1753747-Prorocentrum_lima.AAC.1